MKDQKAVEGNLHPWNYVSSLGMSRAIANRVDVSCVSPNGLHSLRKPVKSVAKFLAGNR